MADKAGVIIQARLGSSRFPRKILADVYEGKSVLRMTVERSLLSGLPVVVACPICDCGQIYSDVGDLVVVYAALADEGDVALRYYKTAYIYGFEYIVRVTGDMPLVDPYMVAFAGRLGPVMGSVLFKVEGPKGFKLQGFRRTAFRKITDWAHNEREHVVPEIQRRHGYCAVHNVFLDYYPPAVLNRNYSVDTKEDLQYIRRIFTELGENCIMSEVLDYEQRCQELL